MANPIRTMSDVVRGLWSAPKFKSKSGQKGPEVIIHDPESERPHDLDDPFFDRRVQSRMADVIANAKPKPDPDGGSKR